MNLKGFGAVLIIAGSTSVGFSIARTSRREARILQNLIRAVIYMTSMLQYNLAPLPELCRQAGHHTTGSVQEILLNLARELDWQLSPDVKSCMYEAVRKSRPIPDRIKRHFLHLGSSLGQFDVPGQIRELESIQKNCEQDLLIMKSNLETRIRSYQTLGICSGAALAILFI